MDADGWTRNDLPPCGGFFGVACNDDNAIVGINLYDNGLSGQFPPEITLLASDGYRSTGAGRLRSLDLYLNVNLGNGNESRWVSELGSGLSKFTLLRHCVPPHLLYIGWILVLSHYSFFVV